MASRTASCTPDSALATFNFYAHATKFPPRGVHCYNMGNEIIEWTGVDVRMITVCKKWKDEIESYLELKWRLINEKFDTQKREVVYECSFAFGDPFRFFRLFNRALAKKLDDEILRPIRQKFRFSISMDRFDAMYEQICVMEAPQKLWEALHRHTGQFPHFRTYPSIEVVTENYPALEPVIKKVEVLDMSCMNLVILPEELFSLSELRELDLSINELTDLPLEMANLKNLRKLDISGNPIEEDKFEGILQTLAKLPLLKYVIFDNDKFKFVPQLTAIESIPTASAACACVVL